MPDYTLNINFTGQTDLTINGYVGGIMEFCLHYYGKLKSRDNAFGKHQIRQQLHPQMRSVCLSDQFREMFKDLDGTPQKGDGPHMYLNIGEKRYWFLISEEYKTIVDLNITILLPHAVGAIVNNG
jgi:hypothetical protein